MAPWPWRHRTKTGGSSISTFKLWFLPRRKFFFSLIALTGLLAFGTMTLAAVLTTAGRSPVLKGRTIVVDPGHGGIDAGTDYGRYYEKDINLTVSRVLRAQLTREGARVITTRDRDTDLSHLYPEGSTRQRRDLAARVQIARTHNAEVLISLHCNWSWKTYHRGPIVYYQVGREDSRLLAEAVQQELNKVQEGIRKIPRPAEFYILRESPMTAIIIEMGFLSNPTDRRLLNQPEYLKKLARAIIEGLETYIQVRELYRGLYGPVPMNYLPR